MLRLDSEPEGTVSTVLSSRDAGQAASARVEMSFDRLNDELARSLHGSLADLGYGVPAGKPMAAAKEGNKASKTMYSKPAASSYGRRETTSQPIARPAANTQATKGSSWTGGTPSRHLDSLWLEVGKNMMNEKKR